MFLLFFILGFFSLISQTIAIREFIISFGGNELGIGLFYFFWLFWVGIGSFLAFIFQKFATKNFFKLLFFYPISAAYQIIFFINLKTFAGIKWWEFFSFEKVLLFLFIFTSFISLLTGVIFTSAVYFFKKKSDVPKIISFAYISESFGSFLAGCLTTILIVKLIPFQTLFIFSSLLFYAICIFLSYKFKEKFAFFLNIILFLIFSILFINHQKVIQFSQNLRLKNLLPNAKLIKEVYSPYQHLILSKLQNQLLIISNGEILNTIPETIDADKDAALLMAETNLASKILIFGYGAENLINSLLKFPIEELVYCIEDKVYFELLKENFKEDKRLKVVFSPPQKFLEGKNKFDLIVVYTSEPTNLVLNNFFTKEFYQLIKNNLKQDGVFATKITSAEDFLGTEIRNYGSSIYYTLKTIFPKIVITAQKINWFFASSSSIITDDARILEERFVKIKPLNSSFPVQGFRSIFLKDRIDFIRNIYENNPFFKNTNSINTISKPLTFFLNLLVLAKYSNSYFVKFLKSIFLIGPIFFIIFLVIFVIFRILFLLRIESIKTKRIVFDAKLFQFFSGFLGFSFHISLIYLFQSIFGTIFQFIGLVNAIFMLGLCFGGFLGKDLLKKFKAINITIIFLVLEGVIFILSYFLLTQTKTPQIVKFLLFTISFFITGLLTGSSYPLVSKLFEQNNVSFSSNIANLTILDHFGGSLAALFVGLLMLPFFGVFGTFFILSVICLSVAFLFILELFDIIKERKITFLSFPYIRTSYTLFAIALAFLINSYFIGAKEHLITDTATFLFPLKNCTLQKQPFPAYVCNFDNKKEYILETDNFVSNIKGFGGPIKMAIKLDENGKIIQITVLEHRETPFYVKDLEKFLKQFQGYFIGEEFSSKNIDTMTGATISSTAIINIVNEVGKQISQNFNVRTTKTVSKQNIIFDKNSIYLILFTFFAIIFHCFLKNSFVRKIYLILVVLILGFIGNLTFSFVHLGNLLTFNFSNLILLSQVFIYILVILTAIFFGQIWCGWLCPFGAIQEIFGGTKFLKKISEDLDRKARYFKYIFLAVFVVILSIKKDVLLFRQEPLSVFFLKPLEFKIDKLLSFIILFFSIFFLRFWCRYFCVCGAFLSLFNKIAILKRYFIKKYKNCNFGVNSQFDLDCLQCNLCMQEKNLYQDKKSSNNFFKFSFFFTFFVMSVIFFSNINFKSQIKQVSTEKSISVLEKFDIQKIKKLIRENKLSDKEALYYEIIE